jgi:hypothetical protein
MKAPGKEVSRFLTITFFVALLAGIPASGSGQAVTDQVSRQVKDDLRLTREVVQARRNALVAVNLDLTDSEGDAFWPLYEEYWAERKKLGDRTVNLISEYAKHYTYESLTNEKAEEMIKEFLAIRKDDIGLKQKYMKKFRKAIPERKLLRYLQIENKLDLIVDAELSARIPLSR